MGSVTANSTTFYGVVGNDSLVLGATSITGAYLSGDAGADTITTGIASGTTVYGGNSTGTFAGGASDGNDTISLTSALASSFVNGNGGADSITLTTSLKSSSIHGGAGNDTITATATATSSTVFGDKGADNLVVGNGTAMLGVSAYGDNAANTTAGAGNDTIGFNAGDSLISIATLFWCRR